MRFLKKKIALSAQSKSDQLSGLIKNEIKTEIKTEVKIEADISSVKTKSKETPTRRRKVKDQQSKEDTKSTKTVVKNYGKAIASFAISPIAVPYLTPLVAEEQINLSEFVDYIGKAKESIEGIDTFRALLLVKEGDTERIAAFKNVFRKIAEIFIKYFSVNWIFSGRMVNKKVHLKFRFKMLRRVTNPELFTYLK